MHCPTIRSSCGTYPGTVCDLYNGPPRNYPQNYHISRNYHRIIHGNIHRIITFPQNFPRNYPWKFSMEYSISNFAFSMAISSTIASLHEVLKAATTSRSPPGRRPPFYRQCTPDSNGRYDYNGTICIDDRRLILRAANAARLASAQSSAVRVLGRQPGASVARRGRIRPCHRCTS